MKGKFIVIEGTDGSGKKTQMDLLQKRLKKHYNKVLIADFPRYYDSVWGKMVGEFLIGKYGKFEEVDPHLVVLPYMIDQYTWSRDVGKPYREKGGLILSNRYFTSNVHQIAKYKGIAQKNIREWIWPLGYEELGLMEPDLVVFLDVPPKISFNLNKKKSNRGYLKGRKVDSAEKNWKHQECSYKEYLRTVNAYNYWKRIKCVTGGKIDSPEIIHKKVWEVVSRKLKIKNV